LPWLAGQQPGAALRHGAPVRGPGHRPAAAGTAAEEDLAWLAAPGECAGWLPPGEVPGGAARPALVDWFAAGAADLRAQFQAAGPDEAVWTWSADHTVGFWQRMQAIEAAVHRWDAQGAVGAAEPVDAALAADAVGQTFEIMVPKRPDPGAAGPG